MDNSRSNSIILAPKSLCEWHEQPVNLLEQPIICEKVHVQILSPNIDRVSKFLKVKKDNFLLRFRQLLVSLLKTIVQHRNSKKNLPTNINENEKTSELKHNYIYLFLFFFLFIYFSRSRLSQTI